MKRFGIPIISILAIAFLAFGQTSIRVFRVPPYPQDGQIPPQYANQYVFADPLTEDYIISYPENLGTPEFAQNPGRRITARVERAIHIAPEISVETRRNEGKYLYEYSIKNGPGARQTIKRFMISLPMLDETEPIAEPAGWIHGKLNQLARSNSPAPTPVPAILENADLGISWMVVGQPHTMAAQGAGARGFKILSPNKPGFVPVFVYGAAKVLAVPGELPDEVSSQLKPLMGVADSKSVMTLGPRFKPDTHKVIIVSDLLSGINRLTSAHKLDADSPFLKEAVTALRGYMQAAEAAGETPLEEFNGPAIQVNTSPAPGLETEIYDAMKLSLDLPEQPKN